MGLIPDSDSINDYSDSFISCLTASIKSSFSFILAIVYVNFSTTNRSVKLKRINSTKLSCGTSFFLRPVSYSNLKKSFFSKTLIVCFCPLISIFWSKIMSLKNYSTVLDCCNRAIRIEIRILIDF